MVDVSLIFLNYNLIGFFIPCWLIRLNLFIFHMTYFIIVGYRLIFLKTYYHTYSYVKNNIPHIE